MVFFLGSLMISCSHNFHNHSHKLSSNIMISTSLHTFESEISKSLSQLSSNHEITLPWIQKCLQILPTINKAFNNLVMDLDYPITSWEMISTDEYLTSSLNSLEYLNSINSSLTQLSQANMVLSHGLTLVKQQGLEPIQIQSWNTSNDKNSCYRNEIKEEEELKFSSEEEWIIHQALLIKRTIWYWVCKVIDSSIHGDVQLEMFKKELSAFSSTPLISLQLCKICEEIKEKKSVLKEVDDVNGSVVRLFAAGNEKSEPLSGAVNELKGKLEVLGKMVENFKDDVNKLFSEVLLGRNNVLDSFQQRKQL